MRLTIQLLTIIAFGALVTASCSNAKKATATTEDNQVDAVTAATVQGGKKKSSMVPKATIYKTNGDYNNNVPITLSADGKSVVSYPAPSDISSTSTPVALKDGYLLDRRGINENSAFTRYTYSEYAALQQAPSTEELLKAVIPGAKVTEIVKLPITLSQAENDMTAVNGYITSGLQGCKIVKQSAPSSIELNLQ
jgi:hypothetical protein